MKLQITNYKLQIFIASLSLVGLVLPAFCLGQAAIPKTMDEAKSFGSDILNNLPGAMKRVWEGEAWPIWLRLWEKIKQVWSTYLWPKISPSWEERKPIFEEEFKKEMEETQNDLWERFKDLLK